MNVPRLNHLADIMLYVATVVVFSFASVLKVFTETDSIVQVCLIIVFACFPLKTINFDKN